MKSYVMGYLSGGDGNDDIVAASRIPPILRVGVTGHRKLNHPAMVETKVREVLAVLDRLLKAEIHYSPCLFMAISPLAEGSDRIVAREVLAWKGEGNNRPSFLEVVLPLPADDYEQDFKTDASRRSSWRSWDGRD
jgi:hypothetical protein